MNMGESILEDKHAFAAKYTTTNVKEGAVAYDGEVLLNLYHKLQNLENGEIKHVAAPVLVNTHLPHVKDQDDW